MFRRLCALGLLLALCATARATDRLVIAPTKDSQPSLVFPSEFVAKHRGPVKQSLPFVTPTVPPILTGVALALAVVLAGLVLLRRASARLATGVAACLLGALLFVNSSCSPDRRIRDDGDGDPHHFKEPDLRERRSSGPPHRPIYGPVLREDGTLQGEVLLEEGRTGDAVRLNVDADTLDAFVKRNAGPAKP